MRRAQRARNAGIERLSEAQNAADHARAVHQHLEVGDLDNRGRLTNNIKIRHIVPREQIASLFPKEAVAKSFFPQWYTDEFIQHILDYDEDQPTGRKRYLETDHPLLGWIAERKDFLDALHSFESPTHQLVCGQCFANDKPQYYRCTECFDNCTFCKECIVARHATNPFHFIEKWNGAFFERVDLRSLDLKVQLGHPTGETCPNPAPPFKNGFTILDTNGIHEVLLIFCQCEDHTDHPIQLLRACLFPATIKDPHTAATFRLLHTFQLHSFLSKVSPYEYYSTLRRLTENTGEDVKDRYKQFLTMIREWRHLKLLKRTGRSFPTSSLTTTAPGQSAVLCPACPHPGINLPSDYSTLPNPWLYRLFTAQDANFRVKRFNVSNSTVDPSLNQGSAYIVSRERYQGFLAGVSNNETVKEETSDCNNHDAIKSASSRGKKGVETTGIAAVECARHGLKRPSSITTLQQGERYVNMDYAFLSALSHTTSPIQIVASYDIACQWSKKLLVRIGEYSPWFTIDLRQHDITYLVPKWHLAAHRDKCQTSYSFNFTPGVGRTDGEAPERGWAAINDIAVSAKEMGPGSWSDSLDDYFGDYNWRKVTSMHSSLLSKLVDAVPERADHVIAFLDFSKAIAKKRLDLVESWTTLVQAWEADNNNPNPFVSTSPESLSLSAVRLQLAQEDNVKDNVPPVHKNITPSKLLAFGLEIEDQQRKLAADWKALGTHPTPLQRSKLLERRSALMRRISAWVDVQHLYIPALASKRQEEGESPIADAYNLYMPSSICGSITFPPKMLEQEWRYRYAQAGTTLNSLRGRLLMRGKMLQSKLKWSQGQGANTRSQRLLSTVQDKIQFDMDKYNDIHSRLQVLGPMLGKKKTWTTIYQVLNPNDVRGIDGNDDDYMLELRRMTEGGTTAVGQTKGERQEKKGERQEKKGKRTTEGRRTFSWIWKQPGVADVTAASVGQNDAVNEMLRIEWCKARARAHRWQEECQLVIEEMRRVKEFFQFEVKRWKSLADLAPTPGHQAYAKRQAHIRTKLYVRCAENWARVDEYLEMGDGGPENLNEEGEPENKRICIEYDHKIHAAVDEEVQDSDEDSDEDSDA